MTSSRNAFSRRAFTSGLVAASALPMPPAWAQEAADFFRGKTIRLIVSTTPGSAYDLRARSMAQHFGRFLPGSPKIVVENMPGAGSLVAMNYMYNLAPRDGTVMCLF